MWPIILVTVPIGIIVIIFIAKTLSGKSRQDENSDEHSNSTPSLNEDLGRENLIPHIDCPQCGFPVYDDETICSNCKTQIRTEIERDMLVEGGKLIPIKKTVIISQDNMRDSHDAIGKAILGGFLFGGAGAIVGGSLGREIRTTTFLLIFEDGSKETREVENNSDLYELYIQHLEI